MKETLEVWHGAGPFDRNTHTIWHARFCSLLGLEVRDHEHLTVTF